MAQVGPLRECQDIMGPTSACLDIIWSPICLCFLYALRNAFAVVASFSAGGTVFYSSFPALSVRRSSFSLLGAALGFVGSVSQV